MKLSLSRLAVASGLFACSALAHAEESGAHWKIKGKLRGDALQSSKTSKTGDDDSSTTKSSSVVLKRAQIEMIEEKGPVEVRIKYYAEANFLKNALVEYKMSENCSLTAGKMDIRDFAWELDYSTTDEYVLSFTGNSSGPVNIAPANAVEAKGVMGDHTLYLQVAQGPMPANAVSTTTSTGGLTTSLQYRGSFADKMVQPIATYTIVNTATSKGDTVDSTGKTGTFNYGNGYQNHMGVGFKILAGGANTDIEYDAAKIIKQKDVDTSKDENFTSIVFQSRLPAFSDVTPYVKAIVDSDKKGADSNMGDVARTAFALGAEYAWTPNLRVHGIFSLDNSTTKSTDSKKAAADKKESTQAINFGMTASL